MNYKRFFLTLAVFTMACALWGVDSGPRLRCRVVNSSKMPISGATLTLQGASLTAIGHSNKKGQYLFEDVPPGQYYLTVEKGGFVSTDLDAIEVQPKKDKAVHVTLSLNESAQLVEIGPKHISAGMQP